MHAGGRRWADSLAQTSVRGSHAGANSLARAGVVADWSDLVAKLLGSERLIGLSTSQAHASSLVSACSVAGGTIANFSNCLGKHCVLT